jgi:nucleoside triphosphate diphosphatase
MNPTPPVKPYALMSLVSIMQDLRTPKTGCPWDLQQDFASIASYTIEEAYEVSGAIDREDWSALRSELGDLLLQVVYHSQLASERSYFTIDDVIHDICAKMIRRHPHVYGTDSNATDSDGVTQQWDRIKSAERAQNGEFGALNGVEPALPALKRAQKLQSRAASVRFDWPNSDGPRGKIKEELQECDDAVGPHEIEHEIGDVLFSVVNWARHLGIDAENALKRANERFEARFAAMERLAGGSLDRFDTENLERLWTRAKLDVG